MMTENAQAWAPRDITQDEYDHLGERRIFGERRPEAFNLPPDPPVCDVVMKGGVTSGLVYPYAVLRLAQKFRLAGIGGTSAGAMAAALTAAAEYARQKGDPSGFARFEERCAELPKILARLFQPYGRHEAVFSFFMALLEGGDRDLSLPKRVFAYSRLLTRRARNLTLSLIAGAFLGGVAAGLWYLFAGRGSPVIDAALQALRTEGWGSAAQAAQAAGVAALTDGWLGGARGVGPALLQITAVTGLAGLVSGVLLLASAAQAVAQARRLPVALYLLFVLGVACISPLVGRDLIPAAWLPAAFGGALAVLMVVTGWALAVMSGLKKTDFGLCSGLKPDGSPNPAVTDWLHEAIQYVAGLPPGRPLTFGDVETATSVRSGQKLALRMITTNLTLRRPYALPDLNSVNWKPSEWRRLFPETILASLGFDKSDDPDAVRPLPEGSRLPIVVGARMSLSFPLLFSAVPVHEQVTRGREKARMLLVDGGLSSNLPLHFFDSLGPPTHPTFALSLEDVREPPTEDERVLLHARASKLPHLTPVPETNFLSYISALLSAAKDWQDKLLSIMPGQFDRIVQIRLGPGEGGLNLAMPPARSARLMRLGYRAGDVLAHDFDLPAHQVRRALAAYQEIERVARNFSEGWSASDLRSALLKATAPVGSRKDWRHGRDDVIERFTQLANWSANLHPPVREKYVISPRGSLRITPNLSGDV